MTRTVKVVLDVEEDPFVRGTKRADDALTGLDKTLGKTDTSSQSTTTSLGKATDQLGKTGRAAQVTAKNFDEMRRHAAALDRQIRDTERGLVSLAKGFANTGDVKMFKAIGDQQSVLRSLQNVRKLLPDADKAGRQVGSSFATSMTETVSAASSKIVPILAGAGLVAAPLIGASIAGAVVGAAGLGGVAGGLALAAKDPRVKAAGLALGDEVTASMTKRSAAFVAPALDGIGKVRRGFREVGPDLDRIFFNSSKFVDPLVDGAVSGAQRIVRGVDEAVGKAGPIMDQLGGSLDRIGGAIGNSLTVLAGDADEGASALDDLTTAAENFIAVSTGIVHALATTKGWFDELDSGIDTARYWLEDQSGVIDLTADGYAKGTAQAEAYRRKTLGVATAADEALLSGQSLQAGTERLTGAMGGAAGAANRERAALTGVAAAIRAQSDPVFALLEAQHNLAEAQNAATRAQQRFGRNSPQAREALREVAQAALGLGSAAAGVGDTFSGKMTPAMRATLRAAGVTKGQIRELEIQFMAAKAAGDRFAKTYAAQMIITETRVAARGGPRVVEQQPRGSTAGLARGGIVTPMAAGGIGQIYPASNPPLYRYAEPETGGEAFIPKRGDRRRGRQLVTEVASWYGMAAVPMAAGGITTAAAGLVNAEPRTAVVRTGSSLDSASAYLSAREAVAGLNAALRENGRSFSVSTIKGRENRSALYSSISAAQAAATAKFEETGSVKAANAAYDDHIERLKRTLRQQKVNGATIKSLLGVARRPGYDLGGQGKAPSNSASTIAFVKDKIGLDEATLNAANAFSWGKPSFDSSSATGRDELTALFAFLAQAGQAAQSRYAQTGSTKVATAFYNSALAQLRAILAKAGMSKGSVDSLLQTYGRITLTNRMGGVYEHAQNGILRDAHLAAPVDGARYAYAERATGGELFAPKRGNLAKTRAEVGYAVRNWWGGRVDWQPPRGGGGASNGSMTIRMVVQDGAVAGLVHVVVDEQLGALADAHVYSTAD